MSTSRKIKKIILIIPFLLVVFLFIYQNQDQPIVITKIDTQQTTKWKIYNNHDYKFSFKYPEVELSNFQISEKGISASTYKQISHQKKLNKPYYNVVFEAGAVKTNEKIENFINSHLPETRNIIRQKIKIGSLQGIRISNTATKSNAYFLYNIFQNGNFIYNFSLVSDDPVLIEANSPLLDKIQGTIEFY